MQSAANLPQFALCAAPAHHLESLSGTRSALQIKHAQVTPSELDKKHPVRNPDPQVEF